jgi:hypothetical protein
MRHGRLVLERFHVKRNRAGSIAVASKPVLHLVVIVVPKLELD